MFLLLTALIRNFYKAIIQRLDVKRFGLNLSDNSVMLQDIRVKYINLLLFYTLIMNYQKERVWSSRHGAVVNESN